MVYTQTFLSDNNPSGTPLSGTYVFQAGTVLIPSGATLPVGTHAGQIIWINPSGKLGLFTGSTWIVVNLV